MRGITSSLMALLIPSALAWSGDSHKIVAKIATNPDLLSGRAKAFILEHFPETAESRDPADALVPIADWADGVPSSDDYHFTNTPFRQCDGYVYNAERDCGYGPSAGKCLVTGIELYFARAANISLPVHGRKEAIMFLVHLIGDATQPLHTGFREDAGGNFIPLSEPAAMTLHQFWDHGLLDGYRESRHSMSWEAVAAYLASKAISRERDFRMDPLSVNTNSFAAAMVTETVTSFTCMQAYMFGPPGALEWITPGHAADRMYNITRSATVLNQLLKAGIRLAQVLNTLADIHADRGYIARDDRKALIRAEMDRRTRLAASTTADPIPSIASPNYWEPLWSLNINLEDCVTEEKAISSIATAEGRPRRRAAVSTKTKGESDEDFLRRTAAERAGATLMGIQLDELVLLERGHRLILTYSALAKRGYFPLRFRPKALTLTRDGEPIIFVFDDEVFGHLPDIPFPLILSALQFIQNGRRTMSDSHTRADDRGLMQGGAGTVALDERLTERQGAELVAPTVESLERAEVIAASLGPRGVVAGPRTDARFIESGPKLISIVMGTHWFVSRADLVRPDPSMQRLTFNCYSILSDVDTNSHKILFLDIRLLDIELTRNVQLLLQRTQAATRTSARTAEAMARNMKLFIAMYQMSRSPMGGLATPLEAGGDNALLASVVLTRPDKPEMHTVDLILNKDFVFSPAHEAIFDDKTLS